MPSVLCSSTAWFAKGSQVSDLFIALSLSADLVALDLLYIHRSYFVQAIREASANPLGHKYAASVLATYRSACRLITSLRGMYPNHPDIASRCWFFWSGIFSALVSVSRNHET
jgi:hypothetical protein